MPLRIIKVALERELKNKYYNSTVDLGCGGGETARILREHTNYLVGVDLNEYMLRKATATKLYDKLVLDDIRRYVLSSDVDLVCLMEVIEHIKHEDGEELLKNLQWVPNIILSTPKFFFKINERSDHVSLWTEEQLQQYGFQTRILNYPFYPPIIFATKHF